MKSLNRNQILIQGTILWRPVTYATSGAPQLLDASFDLGKDGKSYIGRLSGSPQRPQLPILEPEMARVGGSGIVVLLREVPPEGWTHLVVSGLGDRNVFAYVPEPFDVVEYIVWRQRVAGIVNDLPADESIENVRSRLLAAKPPSVRKNEVRAVWRGNARDGYEYVYLGSGEYAA
jgi:hypothetical protein